MNSDYKSLIIFLVSFFSLLFVWLVIVCFCNAKHRRYICGNHQICVYAGWLNHFLQVDGKLLAECRHFGTFGKGINLNAQLPDMQIKVKISFGFWGNTVLVFANNQTLKPVNNKQAKTFEQLNKHN